MDGEDANLNEQSKPVMLFGRDIRKIPCFKYSMLYGIYGGLTTGLVTFLLTSRVTLATNTAMGSYVGIAMVYWFYCRYEYVKTKYAISEIQQILQRGYDEEATCDVREQVPERNLNDA